MHFRLLNFSIWGLLLLSCAGHRPQDIERGARNPLLQTWLPFAPERVQEAFNHTLIKFYRAHSDCQPNCPAVDVWRYQYKPASELLSSVEPISTKKQYWKIPSEARVMVVSLFGDKKYYYDGLLDYIDSFTYIKSVNKIPDKLWGYETFTVRVYVAKRDPANAHLGPLKGDTPDAFIKILLDRGCEVAYVDNGLDVVRKDATFWRFLVADEKMPPGQKIRYMSRDADWKLTAGELYSVGEWIASGLPYHRMNLAGACMGPLTASFWAGSHVGDQGIPHVKQAMEFFPYRYEYGDDELFTRDLIWPHIKYRGVMTHVYNRGWDTTFGNPYFGSCEEPTQEYCDALNRKAVCKDVVLPSYIEYPAYRLAMREKLEDLKKTPSVFDMHLDDQRGQVVRKALAVD